MSDFQAHRADEELLNGELRQGMPVSWRAMAKFHVTTARSMASPHWVLVCNLYVASCLINNRNLVAQRVLSAYFVLKPCI